MSIISTLFNSKMAPQVSSMDQDRQIDREIEWELDRGEAVNGISATFLKDQAGEVYRYIVYGKAAYEVYGKDIVAAAVSALTINTMNAILQLTDAQVETEVDTRNGVPYMSCRIKEYNNADDKIKCLALMKALIIGMKGIEEKYGVQYVRVREK